MAYERPMTPFKLTPQTTGADLAAAFQVYLAEATAHLETQTTLELISAIKASSSTSELGLSEKDWERLANAALTIGSQAIDRVTRRLSIQGAAIGWSPGFDYRPIATQIHALANPARKIRNAIAHRAKCVRAVLKIQEQKFETPLGAELASRTFATLVEVRNWQTESFLAFEKEGSVSERFHTVYKKEWNEFCEEWNSASIEIKQYSKSGLGSIFEKYLVGLTNESNKSKIQWQPVLNKDKTRIHADAKLSSGIPVDFKRRQESFTFSMHIPDMRQSDYNTISLDLMNLIEITTGLKHIDSMRGGKDPDILNIDVYGEYTLAQAGKALEAVDLYFQKRYPSGI